METGVITVTAGLATTLVESNRQNYVVEAAKLIDEIRGDAAKSLELLQDLAPEDTPGRVTVDQHHHRRSLVPVVQEVHPPPRIRALLQGEDPPIEGQLLGDEKLTRECQLQFWLGVYNAKLAETNGNYVQLVQEQDGVFRLSVLK